MQANTVVPATRLVDGLWIEDPPASATNLVQGYVSGLRKVLGKSALETRGAGYVLRVEGAALDLHRFERRLQEGSRALDARHYGEASGALHEALGLWQGSALADLEDEPALDTTVSRLEELLRCAVLSAQSAARAGQRSATRPATSYGCTIGIPTVTTLYASFEPFGHSGSAAVPPSLTPPPGLPL
jgi:DNA-binding SARP family transcriptional activator